MVYQEIKDPFRRFVRIMERLQEPGGCAWDLEQTHESLKQYLIEETYETLEAIDRQDYGHLKEELGDLLLQVVFHAVLAARFNRFNIDEIIDGASEKMVRRHPHVFGDAEAETANDVLNNWEKLKADERREKAKTAGDTAAAAAHKPLLASIPAHLPALLKAQRMQEKAARVGFEFSSPEEVIDKLAEELHELSAEIKARRRQRAEEEFGDLVFSLVNVARVLDINAEEATRQTCERFRSRFGHVEEACHARGKQVRELSKEELLELWASAKQEQRSPDSGT